MAGSAYLSIAYAELSRQLPSLGLPIGHSRPAGMQFDTILYKQFLDLDFNPKTYSINTDMLKATFHIICLIKNTGQHTCLEITQKTTNSMAKHNESQFWAIGRGE